MPSFRNASVPAGGRIAARLVLDAKAQCGESPVWDANRGAFLWVDNVAAAVHQLLPHADGVWVPGRSWLLARPVAAALPRRSGGLILAGGADIVTMDEAGNTSAFAKLAADPQRVRVNEAKCDPAGRLWAGTCAHALTVGGGALYRIDLDGHVHTMLEGVTLSNGMDWSPDGSRMYFADSALARIDAFDFDAGGTLSGRRTIVSFGAGESWPDGLCVDCDGYLWVAMPLSGEIRRFAPNGTQVATVSTSALFTTSCAFGGPDGGTLLITSGAMALPPPLVAAVGFAQEVAHQATVSPGAGGLFVCRPGVQGRAAHPFAG